MLFTTKLTKRRPDYTKVKDHYELFLKNKVKQICKTSNNSNTKSVAVKHPKTASNSLKYIEKSNIITQELETVEKPNIFDIELVNIEHKKNDNQGPRKIKIITQQLTQTEVYTESKATDRM